MKGLSKQCQDKGIFVPYTAMDVNTKEKLVLITRHAREEPKLKFISLMHLLNASYLMECCKLLKKGKAAGVDGRTTESYTEEEIRKVLTDTVMTIKQKKYHPQPVKRIYIESGSRKRRPLGIPTVIDRIVQLGIGRILEAIYEPTFLPVSYGYRPGRNAHEALKEINHMIMGKQVNWIIDTDIKSFFDHIDHKIMMRCLDERIKDPNLKLLIRKFLKAGIMEEGVYRPSEEGAPQGAILSPILANIYLHYVLDLWFEKREKKKLKGYAKLIRYADDFLVGIQYRSEAESVLNSLSERLGKFGLTLSKEKTRIIEFGRFAKENMKKRKEGKPKTFDFAGFTHYCTQTRDGRFQVRVRTKGKRMNKAMGTMKDWIKDVRNSLLTRENWQKAAAKLQGHYNYYGVSGNYESIKRYYQNTRYLIFKWMNRRSQKATWSWDGFEKYLKTYPLPRPKLTYAIYNTW